MNKLTIMVLSLLIIVSLTACGNQKVIESEAKRSTTSATEESNVNLTDGSDKTSTDESSFKKTGTDKSNTKPGTATSITNSPSDVTTLASTTSTTKVATPGEVILPLKGKLPLSMDKKQYLSVEHISELNGAVTVTIKNTSNFLETDQDESYITYVCYDKSGNALKTDDFSFGRLKPGKSFTGTIMLPKGTTKLEWSNLKVRYWESEFTE